MFGKTPAVEFAGSVHFRGTFPLRATDFHFLRDAGVELTEERTESEGPLRWELELRHPEWGEARLLALREPVPIPRLLIEHTSSAQLTRDEKAEALLAGSSVELTMELKGVDPLRERKQALRFLRAVMGEHGTLCSDHVAQLFWSRDALADELAHDAALDVSALFTVHAVGESDEATWLHTHGLGALGSFDFDVLAPSADVAGRASRDLFRALAWAVLESGDAAMKEELGIFTDGYPVILVPAEEFDRRASSRFTALRTPDDHTVRRGVICDPVQRSFFRRSPAPQPAKRLTGELPPTVGFRFSNAATDQIAARALQTWPLLRKLAAELAEFECQALVKLGIPVDGASDGEREHMWFEVHEVFDDGVDATLVNQPWNVSAMKQGDRGRHPATAVSDWTILTPLGNVTPSSSAIARFLRAHREELLAALAQQSA